MCGLVPPRESVAPFQASVLIPSVDPLVPLVPTLTVMVAGLHLRGPLDETVLTLASTIAGSWRSDPEKTRLA